VTFSSVRLLGRVLCLALLVSIIGLTACQKKAKGYPSDPPEIPCKVYGASDEAIIKMQAEFNQKGVRVISIGQNYLISIPSSMIFADQSPRIKWASYQLLNDVSCYLRQFRKVAVNVTSFSSKYKSNQRERALTLARARAVGDYLWSQCINSRFIFTDGHGSDKPVIKNLRGGDYSPNSRIELTFRRTLV